MIYKRYFFSNEEIGETILDNAWSSGIEFVLLSIGSKGRKTSYKLRFKSETQYWQFNELVRLFLSGK